MERDGDAMQKSNRGTPKHNNGTNKERTQTKGARKKKPEPLRCSLQAGRDGWAKKGRGPRGGLIMMEPGKVRKVAVVW